MDKETLVKIAQPAATALLALSIVSHPLIVNSEVNSTYDGHPSTPIHIKCVSGC